MKVIISKTLNGAWVRMLNKEDKSVPVSDYSYTFDCYKHDGDDMSEARLMLYDILDWFGWVGSKHDKERIEVRIVHGSSYECTDKDCRICKD